MASGPYKSKLLQLVFRQYHKNRARYQQATQQAKVSAVRGAIIGGAWFLSPIKGLFRISERLTGRWKQVATSFHARQLRLSYADEAIEQIISETSDCLSTQQGEAIQALPLVLTDKSELSFDSTGHSISRTFIKGWLARVPLLSGWIQSNRSRHITGFASDLETRDTVLIFDYVTVWNGLCDDQQQTIRENIALRLAAYDVTQVLDNRNADINRQFTAGTSKRTAIKTMPSASWFQWAQFARSFWVDVLWAVVHRSQSKRQSLRSGEKQLQGQPSFTGDAIAQIVLLLDQCLSAQQSEEIHKIQLPFDQKRAQPKLPIFTSGFALVKGWFSGLAIRTSWIQPQRTSQITGFASDLKTRHTLLVLENKIVWDGLCDAQRERINRQIAQQLAEDEIIRVADDDDIIFWDNLLATSVGIHYVGRLLAGSQLTSSFLYKIPLPILNPAYSSAPKNIEANVISSSYIELPLERFLNWLDRRLSYLEQQLQRLIDWLQRVIQTVI